MNKNLNLFNTLSNKKEKFTPLNNNKVGMYVCGPTVYDFPHIGNARPLVVFDVLFRLLQRFYGKNKVTYVRNITDIDDKIIESSKKNKKTIKDLTENITQISGTGDGIYGIYGGGNKISGENFSNIINRSSVETLGNAIDFGDLTEIGRASCRERV